MDKRTKQKLNSIQRAEKIYKLYLSEDDYERLCQQISSNQAVFVERQSSRVSQWLVTPDYVDWFPVIYDKDRNSIATFLSRSYRNKHYILEGCLRHRIVSKNFFTAQQIMRDPVAARAIRGVISIGDPLTSLPLGFHEVNATKLRLEFHDVNFQNAFTFKPKFEDVEKIIGFGHKVLPNLRRNQFVLIHCQAGMGRSPAADLILRTMMLGKGQEFQAMHALKEENSVAMPNTTMIEMADHLLERDGELLRARDCHTSYYWFREDD